MKNTLVFDMDGTIADLYGVSGWLEMLRNEDATPYKVAKPLYDMDTLNFILGLFKEKGWHIVVTTWLAKESTRAYDALVREAKIEWLDRMHFPYDEIHLVPYGTVKETCTKKYGGFQVLVDDNEEIRASWTMGDVINANEDILGQLIDLL